MQKKFEMLNEQFLSLRQPRRSGRVGLGLRASAALSLARRGIHSIEAARCGCPRVRGWLSLKNCSFTFLSVALLRGVTRSIRSFATTLMTLFLLCFSVGCGERLKPTFEYMPGMMDTAVIKAQEFPMRSPVEGTIPRGFEPYPYKAGEGPLAAQKLINPLPMTRDVLMLGQESFNTYCVVCHGPQGLGNGSVVPKFPRPPVLTSDKIRNWKDGEIYHTIMMGQNLMPSYASQTTPKQRWAIAHYIRALQRADRPTEHDLDMLRDKLKTMKQEMP